MSTPTTDTIDKKITAYKGGLADIDRQISNTRTALVQLEKTRDMQVGAIQALEELKKSQPEETEKPETPDEGENGRGDGGVAAESGV